jgi:hypothetical protein
MLTAVDGELGAVDVTRLLGAQEIESDDGKQAKKYQGNGSEALGTQRVLG